MKSEEQAQQQIDERLQAAVWTVQSRGQVNLGVVEAGAVGKIPVPPFA